MQINPLIFREYDIRGIVDKDLSEEFAYLLGRAYAGLAKDNSKNNIAIGHDCRFSSKPYAQALARGMADEGVDCCILGMGPTPQLYFAIFTAGYGGGIQVTGSHNPPDMNGFKICLGTDTLSGDKIQDLKERVLKAQECPPSCPGKGTISERDIREEYVSHHVNNCLPHVGQRKLKVVVDAGNGVGGMAGPDMLRGLGVDVVELFTEPDGAFPNHHPDPTVMKNLEELIKTVKETGADCGIGWDGDADRIGVVDEKGKVIFGDMLLLIYARDILSKVPGATIIGDVKCSSRLFDDIAAKGGTAVMWKTGHSLIKNRLKEIGAELGGEMSGHIFFKHRFFGFDDALYCSCRLTEILSNTTKPLSALLADLPEMVATPEIRIECPEELKFKIADAAKQAFPEYETNDIDGVRIRFEKGWGLVRASNTQPVLVLRFEAENEELLEKYRELVSQRLEKIKESL
ncbi:MAG: phosphomannomutase/phosphoglucomutase [Candidatus Dadabacteria bacterium]|nr:MAG: phosphomannomutase/phosphoglucomutase [Candidatus Dadabacteria bacterium]